MSKNNFARIVAGLGAVAGGYMQGKRRFDESERDAERFEREREEAQLKKDERQAAASTLARAGTQTGEAVSGEDALTAGNQALTDAMARAGTPEEKAAVQQQYAPTMAALTAQLGTAATPGATYTPEQAQGDYVRKMYSIDPAKAQQAEATQMQLDEGRDKADKRKRLKTADTKLREWGDKHIQKDGEGNPIVDDDSFIKMGKMRSILLAQQGLHDEAMQNAGESMQYVTRKIQADNAVRSAKADEALRAFDKGDYSVALQVYDMVPDGSKATGVKVGKDGKVTVTRVSALDGAPLADAKFNDLAELRATVEGMKDPNAVINHVERTFKRDIEVRKVKADESRAGSAASSAASTVALHGAQTDEIKQKTADRKDLAVIHTELTAAIDGKDAAAEKAARAKLSAYTSAGRGSQTLSPEERKANFYLASGKAKTPEEAATLAHQKVQASAADDFREFSKPNSMGMAPNKNQVDEFMALQHGPNWKSKLPGGGAAAAPAKAGWGAKEIK